MGVDEIYLGKKQKFLTVVTNLKTGEPLWFGRERKKETLDEFFEQQSQRVSTECDPGGMRGHVGAVSAKPGAVGAGVPDRVRQVSHLQHASEAVDEVRRAEFFRKGGAARDLVRGKRWLLLTSWLTWIAASGVS